MVNRSIFNEYEVLGKEEWDTNNHVHTHVRFRIFNKYFLLSKTIAPDHGEWEAMIFPATHTGEIVCSIELWVVRSEDEDGINIDTTIKDFVDGGIYEYDDGLWEVYGECS